MNVMDAERGSSVVYRWKFFGEAHHEFVCATFGDMASPLVDGLALDVEESSGGTYPTKFFYD